MTEPDVPPVDAVPEHMTCPGTLGVVSYHRFVPLAAHPEWSRPVSEARELLVLEVCPPCRSYRWVPYHQWLDPSPGNLG